MNGYLSLAVLLSVYQFAASANDLCASVPHGALIPHPTDCTKFIHCAGEGYIKDCPAGLHFNPNLRVCDWPENAGCTSTTTQSPIPKPTTKPPFTTQQPKPGCSGVPDGTIFPDYDDKQCRKYQICIIDKWVVHSCDKPGEIFSKYEMKCRKPDGSCLHI